MAGTGDRKDPFHGFNFRVEIGGIQRAGFREASGLDSSGLEPRTLTLRGRDETVDAVVATA